MLHDLSSLKSLFYNGKKNDVVAHSIKEAEGQTSGEWVSPGTYFLPKGKSNTVTLTTRDADGNVTADAFLCVPQK